MEENGLEISTIEMHTGGEPLRIIASGFPEIKGDTILDKRRYVRENLDHLRKLLMFEPRGHYDMYGAVIVQPHSEMADLGVIFMHNEGYSTMCGHAVIALGRYAVDSGLLSTDVSRSSVGEVPVFIECPCGVVKALVDIEEGKSGRVRFVSVPAFAFGLDVEINTEKFGQVKVDIGFGGAFYAIVPAHRLGVDVRSSRLADIVEAANAITNAGKSQIKLHHPDSEELAFLYGTIITDGKDMFNSDSKEATANVCVFADSEVRIFPIFFVLTDFFRCKQRGGNRLGNLEIFYFCFHLVSDFAIEEYPQLALLIFAQLFALSQLEEVTHDPSLSNISARTKHH